MIIKLSRRQFVNLSIRRVVSRIVCKFQSSSSFFSAHYSKSQIFVQKFNFDKTQTFSRVFHPNFFWQFFSWNQSCQQLKCPKPQHFHEFFTQKNRQFSWEIKVEFLDIEDFEHCVNSPQNIIYCEFKAFANLMTCSAWSLATLAKIFLVPGPFLGISLE